jgi:hypothetical protein
MLRNQTLSVLWLMQGQMALRSSFMVKADFLFFGLLPSAFSLQPSALIPHPLL